MFNSDERFLCLLLFRTDRLLMFHIGIRLEGPDSFHDLFFDRSLFRMNLFRQKPEKPCQKGTENEINQRSQKKREKCFVGSGADDIRSLGEVNDGNVTRDSCHFYCGDHLSAVGGQEMDQSLGPDHLLKGLELSKAERRRGFDLPGRHSFDTAPEDLRAVGGEFDGKCDGADPEGAQSAFAQDDIIQNKQQYYNGERLEDPDIQTGKCTDIGIPARAQKTDQPAQGCSQNPCDQRQENRHPESGKQDLIPVFCHECTPDAVRNIFKKHRSFGDLFQHRLPSDDHIVFVCHQRVCDIDARKPFFRVGDRIRADIIGA